ncbi:39S ribosomal protein L1, mitochondrial [Habropoda laboriosa]|uniref:39S ribosomal protein L1, mitochondrial n=2 Tax=Habropoda laboriosa TaxID=597456 RepID=A0A0L7R4E9_9HYME|nr:39S ribosomal protein L1, mitochondrial [Habropoda laboriosa]
MQTREYAARKGTREKARKKKVKKVIEKVGFDAKTWSKKEVKKSVSPLGTIDDSWRHKATDDVWVIKYHQRPIFSFKEAIQCHRETHHPTMFNKSNASVNVFIELDMKREKKNKFVEKFSKVIDTPHTFKHEEAPNKILVFCKNLEEQEKARNAGADFVGGIELIKQIQNGAFVFKEYDYILSHANILTDLLLIRGLLKRKFPNMKTGTLGNDMTKLVLKFRDGIEYTAIPHDIHKDYGTITTTFGLLDMDLKQLEENFDALLNNINKMRPKREELFIQRVQVRCPPSPESLKVNFKDYLLTNVKEEVKEQEEDNTAIISTH